MKKLIFAIVAVVLAIVLALAAYADEPSSFVIGDVDGDGEVTPRDSMILARHIAGWEGYEILPYNPVKTETVSITPECVPLAVKTESGEPVVVLSATAKIEKKTVTEETVTGSVSLVTYTLNSISLGFEGTGTENAQLIMNGRGDNDETLYFDKVKSGSVKLGSSVIPDYETVLYSWIATVAVVREVRMTDIDCEIKDGESIDFTAGNCEAGCLFEIKEDGVTVTVVSLKQNKCLDFVSNGDGTCAVSGIGSVDDTDIVIPEKSPYGDTVTKIAENAFYGQTEIETVTLPESITEIGNGAFSGCGGIDVKIKDLDKWCAVDFAGETSNPMNAGGLLYVDGISAEHIEIPALYTEVKKYTFCGCTGLKSVTIHDSVTKIGDGAFSGCTGIEAVVLPDNTAAVGSSAFENCANLASVTIYNDEIHIGSKAFGNCRKLTVIQFNGEAEHWQYYTVKADDWDVNTGSYTVQCTDGAVQK